MNKTYKLFIFDFDGTLADTKECVVAAMQKSLEQNKFPPVNWEQIVHLMGIPVKKMLKTIVPHQADEMYEKLVTDYRSFYKAFLPDKTFMFPEVAETLARLKEKNILCAIATSKKTDVALMTCKYIGIDAYIDICIGEDLVTRKKPDPESLTVILQKFAIAVKDAVMIGDTTFDMQMGKAIGMDTIAVTWGSHSPKELLSVHPTYTVEKFPALLAFA